MASLRASSPIALLLGALPFVASTGCTGESAPPVPDTGAPQVDAFVPPFVDAGPVGEIDAFVPTAQDAGLSSGVTYYGHLRPVIARHCQSCHVAGGVAPFPLTTYEEAALWGSRLVDVTRDRIMPPYLADNSGDCQTFRDARWLTDAEIDTFRLWYEQGMQMGDPATPPPDVTPPPRLTGSVTTLDIGVDYVPRAGVADDYRCFLVESPGGFVTGYDVHPGNPATVHHVIVYEPTDDGAGAEARANDAAEAGPGYTCYGGAGVNAFPVVLWAPGGGATTFPRGTGVQIPSSRPLIVQIHYNVLAGMGADRTRVDIQTVGSATPAYIVPLVNSSFNIPPRTPSYSSSDEQSLSVIPSGITLRAYGSFPHMHTLGTSLRVDRISGGVTECLLDVPRWDFNWQLAYWYETPIRVTRSDAVRITCEWNSMTRDTATRWGEGTEDEMCLNFFYVSL
ncbi:MAG: hypothetical protein OHK0013_37350 [Sandaracinaceae bacterium]